MTIKSFRGRIADGAIDTVHLHTNNGSVGYRIKKLELMPAELGDGAGEHVVKVYSIPQTTVDGKVDFSDQSLLAAGHIANSATTYSNYSGFPVIIFDNMTFNQDIFITHEDSQGSAKINYYIELEQIKLDLNENTVATLKDIRNIEAQSDVVIN